MKLDRFLARLGSFKLAAWLMVALMGLVMLSVVIPQRKTLGPVFTQFAKANPELARVLSTLQLDRLFGGWAIAVVALVLAVNLVACTLLRLRRHSRPVQPFVLKTARELPLEGDPISRLDAAEEILSARGWRITARSDDGLAARKGEAGFWGSMALHAAIFLVIIGGTANVLTSFRGDLAITQGQTVVDEPAAYIDISRTPLVGPAFTGAKLTLDSMSAAYKDGELVSIASQMSAQQPNGAVFSREVSVNRPLDVGFKTYVMDTSGYAVAVTIVVPGQAPQQAVVRLSGKTKAGWADKLQMPAVGGRPAQLRLEATPVPLRPGQARPPEEFTFRDPRLRLTYVVGGDSIISTELAQGAVVKLGPSTSIGFDRLTVWDRYFVRGAPARWLVYAAFWLAIAGAVVRFLVPERRVSVCVRERDGANSVLVSHRSRPWTGFEADADRELVEELLAGDRGSLSESSSEDERPTP